MLRDQRDLLLLTGKEMWCCYNMINHHQKLIPVQGSRGEISKGHLETWALEPQHWN